MLVLWNIGFPSAGVIDIFLFHNIEVINVILVDHVDTITAIYSHSSCLQHKHFQQKWKISKYTTTNKNKNSTERLF